MVGIGLKVILRSSDSGVVFPKLSEIKQALKTVFEDFAKLFSGKGGLDTILWSSMDRISFWLVQLKAKISLSSPDPSL